MDTNVKWFYKLEEARKQEPDLSLTEFSKRNGIKYNTMKSYIHRAEKKLGKSVPKQSEKDECEILKEEKLETSFDGENKQSIIYTSPLQTAKVHTLQELLKFAGVNQQEWAVQSWRPNVWTVTAKIDGQFHTATNFQVKASLIRKKPTAINLALSPVKIPNICVKPPRLAKKTGLRVSVALFDAHFGFSRTRSGEMLPYHNRNALMTAFEVMGYLDSKFRLNEIVLGGDWLDLAEWSTKFVTRPEFYGTTQPALNELVWVLGYMRKRFPQTKIIYMDGNHEKRVEDFMIQHMGWAYGLTPGDMEKVNNTASISIKNLLGLNRLGIEYLGDYPNNDYWLTNNLRVIHGKVARNGKGDTVKKVASDGVQCSTIFGHIHREESVETIVDTREGRRIYSTVCPGCLCHTDERIPPVGKRKEWTNGFAVAWYDNTYEQVDRIPIKDNRAIYYDKEFSGSSYYNQMKEDMND